MFDNTAYEFSQKRYKIMCGGLKVEEMVKLLEELDGLKTDLGGHKVYDGKCEVIYDILTQGYPLKFIKSKYLSNYMKKNLIELSTYSRKCFSDKAIEALNSNKDFKDMSPEEIKEIYYSYDRYYEHRRNEAPDLPSNMGAYFNKLLLNLKNEGVKELILENDDLREYYVEYLFFSNNIIHMASFYSGLGVRSSDLNYKHLSSFYYQLKRISDKWAKEFVKLVQGIDILGASQFINAFDKFAKDGFTCMKNKSDDNDKKNDRLSKEQQEAVSIMGFIASFGKKTEDNIRDTELMKNDFLRNIGYKTVEERKRIAKIRKINREMKKLMQEQEWSDVEIKEI